MSSSFKTVEILINASPKLSTILRDAHTYWAHVHPSLEPELYEEHYDRVNKYFGLLCRKNNLDPTIDRLIENYARAFFPKSDLLEIGNYIKKLFVNTAVYHDFGKINPNFQAHPKKMNNPAFRSDPKSPLKSHHSKQGAYLFTCRHFQETTELPFLKSPEEQRQMLITVLLFSYPIFKHHASGLLRPDAAGIRFEPEELPFLKAYLDHYDLKVRSEIAEKLLAPNLLKQKFFDWIFEEKKIKFDFSFFALLRLNFSLLTAGDYIATGEYTNQLPINDFGILTESKREEILCAVRTSQAYNRTAYELLESDYQLQHPVVVDEKGKNLNLLRTEMAVEVLRSLQQNADKRLFYLEAPTGGGKTNLSMLAVGELLRHNPELNKVFYVFPFTTLITQTHKNILETLGVKNKTGEMPFGLGQNDVALLHSRAGFQTLQESEKNIDIENTEDGIYGGQKRDFMQNQFVLYPFALVTHVRFFDILKSNRKEDAYLMHRLANSIVVLDELQSYPPKVWDKMMNLLEQYSRYFNIRFILMSATLPRIDRIQAVQKAALRSGGSGMPKIEDLLPNPRRYFINDNFRGRVGFNFSLLNKDKEIEQHELAEAVLEKSHLRAAANAGRVFTIVEFIFKKSATEFKAVIDAKAITEPFFDEVFVLSGTILEHRRREIIYFLKKNQVTPNLKVLLITTQVVEAGVDIDMDLGFKNLSLIDSDEQLAGRVNRNVRKVDCEVYLFNMNKAEVLYGNDFRFKLIREMSTDFHRRVLESKDFNLLYEEVFKKIDQYNESEMMETFVNTYLPLFQTLDFPDIHRKFKLIEQETLSVFVPVGLPLEIVNEKGEQEMFFSSFEKDFLLQHHAFSIGDQQIDGKRVWALFQKLESSRQDDFVDKKIGKKAIQGILSKFTFSLFASPANRNNLISFSDLEKSLENYFYLSHHDEVYHLENGLNEQKLKEPETLL